MIVGVHFIDLLLWWLGDYDSVEYFDDAMGGVEVDCEVHLRMKCGASGLVELSRNRDLRNTCFIRGERAILEVGFFDRRVSFRINNEDLVLTGRVTRDSADDNVSQDAFRRQLDDFADAIRNHRQPFVPGPEGRRAIGLIEACYASRQVLRQPWVFREQPG